MVDSPLILALDMGTSSSRSALFTAEGARLVHTTAQEGYPLLTSKEGGAELEPAALRQAILRCMEETLRQYRQDATLQGRPIAGIGVTSFWHSLIGVNAAGAPLSRVITWADARCRPDAAALRDELSEKAVHGRTGCMLRASFWPAKLVWLRRTQSKLFRQVHRWISPAEWLQAELCGEANCAIGMATGTGIFDPSKLAWDRALLERCAIEPGKLGPLGDAPSFLSEKWARRFPELRQTPWFPGIGDGAASNLGSGATRPGLAALNVGTSAALRVMREGRAARAPFGLFCYRVDAQRYLVGGAVSNAGNLRAWCLRELRLDSDPIALEHALADRPAPEHGLTMLPFWTAERAPTWNEELTGTVIGLRQHTSALDLLQATTEAVFYRLASIRNLILAQEPAEPRILVSGGIQHSPGAMQRLADCLGQPVYANPEPEASIRGAAVFVIEKLGWQPQPLALPAALRPRRKYAPLHAHQREKQERLEQVMARAVAQLQSSLSEETLI
jgi:gluconokinase